MNIRVFQIIVPVLALLVILWQLRKVYLAKALWKDIWPSVLFALTIGLIAIFPDAITNRLAKLLDFKSNINAILFLLIGVLFVSLIQLFGMYRKQQKSITRLTQEIALLMAEKTNTVP